MIQYLYTVKSDHHSKSSYHMSPWKLQKIFSLWWELPGSTLLVIEVNDFLLMVLESQMQQT